MGRVFEPEAKTERRGLDRAQIVRAGLDLLDEVGLEGLTMRRLAERLDVKAASLYWHVQDKDDLLELLADAICAEMRPPVPGLPWREALEQLATEIRRVYRSRRDAAQTLVATIPLGPNRFRMMEQAFAVLVEAGFAPQEAVYAGYILNDFITQFVIEEQRAEANEALAAHDGHSVFADFAHYLKTLPADTYPYLVQFADYMAEADAEPRFRFGLATILDGLERRLRAG